MSNDRLLSLLGIARRAGKLTFGFDAVCSSVSKGECKLILTASDISPGTLRKLRNSLDGCGKEIIGIPYTLEEIHAATGKPVRLLSINDGGFAKKLLALLQQGNGEE